MMKAFLYIWLAGLGFMALVGLVFFIINLTASRRLWPMATNTGGIAPYLALIGLLAFLTGMGLAVFGFELLGLALSGGGFLGLGGSILLNARRAKAKRAAWPVVSARCGQRTLIPHKDIEGGDFWRWRLVCEINFNGRNYQVIPKVRWSDVGRSEAPFRKEKEAWQFLEKTLPASGDCRLRVNPNDPQEAELIG